MSVEKELCERALGHIAVATIEGVYGSGCLEALAENNAIKLLQKIQDILNDKSLSDFSCVEEIVCAMEIFQVSTSRHDFG